MRRFVIGATVLWVGCALPARHGSSGVPFDARSVIAAIEAADLARVAAASAGDYQTATSYIAPEFLFVHSTGQVDDLQRFRAFSERVSGAGAQRRPLEAPQFVIDKDVALRTQLTASSPRPGLPEARYRSLDVFVRRSGQWLWLGHQTAMVQPPWRSVAIAEERLNEFAGSYAAAGTQTRVYTVDAGALVESVLPDGPSGRSLTPLSDSTFAVPPGTTTLTFLRDNTGRVARAQLAGPLGLTVLERR